MNEIITEKKYPIKKLWLLKSVFSAIFTLIFLILFIRVTRFEEINKNIGTFIIIIIGVFSFDLILIILKRTFFHYSIEENFLTLKQGILAKQQRYIPYGVIQNLIVKQDLFDKIFGLATLIIENASEGAGVFKESHPDRTERKLIGFSKNKVVIPGLTKANAEILKEIIFQKMRKKQIIDSQSGL